MRSATVLAKSALVVLGWPAGFLVVVAPSACGQQPHSSQTVGRLAAAASGDTVTLRPLNGAAAEHPLVYIVRTDTVVTLLQVGRARFLTPASPAIAHLMRDLRRGLLAGVSVESVVREIGRNLTSSRTHPPSLGRDTGTGVTFLIGELTFTMRADTLVWTRSNQMSRAQADTAVLLLLHDSVVVLKPIPRHRLDADDAAAVRHITPMSADIEALRGLFQRIRATHGQRLSL